MKPLLRSFGVTAVAVAGGILVGQAIPSAASTTTLADDAVILSAPQQLAAARAAAPFPLVELRTAGVLTIAQSNSLTPTPDGASTVAGPVSVGLFYRLINGPLVHVWQTNIAAKDLSAAGKDPATQPGSHAVTVGATTWTAIAVDDVDPHVQLSRRLPDGRTLTIDARTSERQLAELAQSLS